MSVVSFLQFEAFDVAFFFKVFNFKTRRFILKSNERNTRSLFYNLLKPKIYETNFVKVSKLIYKFIKFNYNLKKKTKFEIQIIKFTIYQIRFLSRILHTSSHPQREHPPPTLSSHRRLGASPREAFLFPPTWWMILWSSVVLKSWAEFNSVFLMISRYSCEFWCILEVF